VLKIEPDRPDQPNSLSLSVLDNITTGDIGLGWQVTPYLSVGLSVGAGLRTASSRLDLLLLGPQVPCGVPLGSGSCYQFLQQSTEEDVLAVGGRAKVGVRFTPTDSLSFGLSAASPSLDVFGRSKLSVITSTALSDGAGGDGFGPGLLRFEGTSDLSLPFRLAVGAAYSTKRFSNVIASNFELRGDSTIRRWTLAGFIGSNYSFAAEKEEPKGPRPDP
jgi:hypothetical protein